MNNLNNLNNPLTHCFRRMKLRAFQDVGSCGKLLTRFVRLESSRMSLLRTWTGQHLKRQFWPYDHVTHRWFGTFISRNWLAIVASNQSCSREGPYFIKIFSTVRIFACCGPLVASLALQTECCGCGVSQRLSVQRRSSIGDRS